jgi:hypothetical protein
MGTSSIYDGPKDKNPLLPDDFDDSLPNDEIPNDDNEDEKQENDAVETPKPWQAVKTAMSKHINGNGGSNSAKHIAKGYVKASGGSSSLARNSRAGISSTVSLGNILSSIRREGIINTLELLNIQYAGKNVREILSELVNIISFNSNTKEDVIAKKATISALSDIYEYIEKNGMDITCLSSMDQEMIDKILCSYIGAYIWGRMLNDLQSRFEKYSNDAQKTIEIEKEFKLYIDNTVKVEYRKCNLKDASFRSKDVNEIITNLYRQCYNTLEVSI